MVDVGQTSHLQAFVKRDVNDILPAYSLFFRFFFFFRKAKTRAFLVGNILLHEMSENAVSQLKKNDLFTIYKYLSPLKTCLAFLKPLFLGKILSPTLHYHYNEAKTLLNLHVNLQ